MALFKCKMCGGDLVLTEGSTIATCEYCGSVQTVPSADNEKKLTLFERANRYRADCEFDKAAGVYESIISDFPEEAEAYWGLILCKYGIEYVDDPKTGKKIPTCHRSSYDSLLDDSDLEKVLDNADSAARKLYQEEARQIENLRKDILEVSGKEEPYDIFICYKETDKAGNRTVDSVLAQDLYTALVDKGYRVFFSRITLEDKLGQAYEPYIFAALNSAKVMLAVGTDYEHFNAVWVRNEWSRFLKLTDGTQKKVLIPCYKDIDAYDMPKEFRHLQAQDLGKVGAVQDLLRGVEKLLSQKVQKAAPSGMTKEEKTMVEAMKESQRKTRAVILSTVFLGVFALAGGGLMFENDECRYLYQLANSNQGLYMVGNLTFLGMFLYGLFGIGLGLTVTYGFRSKAAHWLYLAFCGLASLAMIGFKLAGNIPGVVLWAVLIPNGLMALITAVTAYFDQRKRVAIRLMVVGLLLALSLVFGLF